MSADELPNSLKAEQAVLGILLYDNSAVERVPEFMRDNHFFDPVHQRLYAAITGAINAGGAADPMLLMERFAKDEAFEAMGGFSYLADLVDHAPASILTSDLCHLIYDRALRRQMLRLSDEVASASQNDLMTPVLDLVDKLERQLFDLTSTREDSGPVAMVDTMADAIEMIAGAYARDGALAGLSTGLLDLDKKLGGLKPADLIILGARPSMGKTSLALDMAFHNAKTYTPSLVPGAPPERGGVTALFSLEMSGPQLGIRLLSQVSGIASTRLLAGDVDVMEFSRVRDGALEIQECPLYIDATGAISLAAIATRCRRLKRTVGLDLVVIDYLQLMGESRPGMNREERISANSSGLKALAKELGIPIVALSQVSRQVEQREDKRPQLSDLRESGAIEQDADVVMFLYRHVYYLERAKPKEGTAEFLTWEEEMDRCRHLAEVIIAKQRSGPIGTAKVSFDENLTRFGNLARDQ